MCGIVGIVNFALSSSGVGHCIGQMGSILRHRGPNDEGYLLANMRQRTWLSCAGKDTMAELGLPALSQDQGFYDLALGHRRLSILDLSAAGHGPMSYHDGQFWITYNGEIYNYLELRQELRQKGYVFQTQTDTEVILAAYREWGPDCLQYFNGMWAFAIWDVARRQLFCARDRFGIKPFFYYWDGKLFAFASEIKALLVHPDIPKRPNDAIIYDYLVLGALDHTENSFFAGIKRLMPSHSMILDFENKTLEIKKWWDIRFEPGFELNGGDSQKDEAVARFRALLTDAIRLRLRSDVPIGTNLSGGLDSSSIVCLANQLMFKDNVLVGELKGNSKKTFTAYFDDPRYDEREFVSKVIHQTNFDSHLVSPKGKDGLWREIERFIWHQDEPIAATSPYAQWSVMQLAAQQGVTVLLDGQGGDEILAGYSYYFGPYLVQNFHAHGMRAMMSAAHQLSANSAQSLTRLLGLSIFNGLPPALQSRAALLGGRYFRKKSTLSKEYLNHDFSQRFSVRDRVHAKHIGYERLSDRLYVDIFTHSLPALLRYEDRNSMAFSLEARVPFLDHRLVEFCFSLPSNLLIQNGWTKWLLREAMSGVLPDAVRWRKTKLGFATPEANWLQEGSEIIRRDLTSSKIKLLDHYLNRKKRMALKNETPTQLATIPGIWRLLNLASWLNVYWGDSHFS